MHSLMGNKISSSVKRKRYKTQHADRLSKTTHEEDSDNDENDEVLEIEMNYDLEVSEHIAGSRSLRMVKCFKEEKHDTYILFQNLSLQDVPETIRHQAVLDYINARGKLVVKISVCETSPDRSSENNAIPSSHSASGYACMCDDEVIVADCPIKDCMFSSEPHKVYAGVLVTTNKHVIHDDFETLHSEFDFFYEAESAAGQVTQTVTGHGHTLRDHSENKDYVGVKILMHDPKVVEMVRHFGAEAVMAWNRIPPLLQKEFETQTVIISHPHGWPKRVSFGRLLEMENFVEGDEKNSDEKFQRFSTYTSLTCSGSSGSPILTGFYWNNPFVHSKGRKKKVDGEFVGVSYSY